MRKDILTLASVFILGMGITFAQEIPQKNLPQPIQTNFAKKFPKASDIEWEKEGVYYKIEFELNKSNEYDAWYNKAGDLIKYKAEVAHRDIPKVIMTTINNKYAGYEIDDAEKLIENGIATYKIEIEKGEDERDLWFTEAGEELNFTD